jgi:hypothetical protein
VYSKCEVSSKLGWMSGLDKVLRCWCRGGVGRGDERRKRVMCKSRFLYVTGIKLWHQFYLFQNATRVITLSSRGPSPFHPPQTSSLQTHPSVIHSPKSPPSSSHSTIRAYHRGNPFVFVSVYFYPCEYPYLGMCNGGCYVTRHLVSDPIRHCQLPMR